MLKVRSGELDILGLLYERYKRRLFGFFYQMHRDAALSEDMVQNVFMRVLKYRHTFTGEGSFAAWLFRMARNVNNDHWKKNRRNTQELSPVAFRIAGDEDTGEAVEQHEEFRKLQWALARLPADKREILVLSKLKEMKFKQIAEILDCTESAAKVKAHRALKDLRKIFADYEKA